LARRLTVVQLLPALESGGVERSTLEIATALVADGHRSVVISAGGRLLPRLLDGGSEHITLAIGRKSLTTFGLVFALRRALDALAADVVHVRSRLPAWLTRLALPGVRPRPHLISTVHGLNSPGPYSAIMTRADQVIAVSRSVRAYLLQHYPRLDPTRIRVIPRGIDPAAFPHGFQPTADWRDRFNAEFPALAGGVLLSLPARGTRLKGHAEAIDLLARLRASGVDARLMLLGAIEPGRDVYLESLRQQARAAGVFDVLAMTPPRDDVREVMACSQLVLQLSSKPEAFGRTVVEALSLGRPVLGHALGGVGDLLQAHFPDGLVEIGNPQALLVKARGLLALDVPIPPQPLPTLAAMQQATLALYREVAGA